VSTALARRDVLSAASFIDRAVSCNPSAAVETSLRLPVTAALKSAVSCSSAAARRPLAEASATRSASRLTRWTTLARSIETDSAMRPISEPSRSSGTEMSSRPSARSRIAFVIWPTGRRLRAIAQPMAIMAPSSAATTIAISPVRPQKARSMSST